MDEHLESEEHRARFVTWAVRAAVVPEDPEDATEAMPRALQMSEVGEHVTAQSGNENRSVSKS